MRILVTGATGFIGRRTVSLLLARGYPVRAALRNPAMAAGAIPPDCETVLIGDIGPDTDWSPALTAIDAVVHLAARVHIMRDTAADPPAAFRHVNTLGAIRLAEAAAAAGVGRMVFISSIKAGDGNLPPSPDDPYAMSKWEAEQALAEISARTGIEAVILQPPLVYGPGVGGNFLSLLRLVARGIPLPLASVDNRRSLLHVDNLADAIARSLEQPLSSEMRNGDAFALHDGAPVSTPSLIRQLAAGMNRPARLFPCPLRVLRTVAALTGRRPVIERLAGSLTVDDHPLRQWLSWTPPITTPDGLAATAHAFLNGYRQHAER